VNSPITAGCMKWWRRRIWPPSTSTVNVGVDEGDHRHDVVGGERAHVGGERGVRSGRGRERRRIATRDLALDRCAGAVERAGGGA
jgi:hypothetical protein